MTKTLIIYTATSFSAKNPENPQGAWATVIDHDGSLIELSGYSTEDKVNALEIKALVEALHFTQCIDQPVIVRSRNSYLIEGCSKNLKTWKANNWLTSKGTPVENQKLWQQLEGLCKNTNITFERLRRSEESTIHSACKTLAEDTRLEGPGNKLELSHEQPSELWQASNFKNSTVIDGSEIPF